MIKRCERFKTEYAHYIGTRHCVSCAIGLDALILMFRTYMEIGPVLTDAEIEGVVNVINSFTL